MDFLGYTTRSFAEQTGNLQFSFVGSANHFNKFDIGLSGSVNTLNISFESGKIYSNSNNFITSYGKNENFKVSINTDTNYYNLNINNTPYVFGETLSNTGSFDHFYINTPDQITLSSVDINGNLPAYGLITGSSFTTLATGAIINSGGTHFRVFSGDADLEYVFSGAPFDIEPFESGQFFLEYTGSSENPFGEVPVNLYTNFGLINFNYNIASSGETDSQYLIMSDSQTGLITNLSAFLNMSARITGGSNLLSARLEYVSGYTGYYYTPVFTSGLSDPRTLSATLTGSGLFSVVPLSGVVSGFDGTPINAYTYATGSGQSNFSQLAYATGNNTFYYSGTGIGQLNILFSGANVSGIMGTGFTTGSSGRLIVSADSGVFSTGGIIYLNADSGYFGPSGYETGTATPLVPSGLWSGRMPYTRATGFVESGGYQGLITGYPLFYTGTKTFFNTWNLLTGNTNFNSSGFSGFAFYENDMSYSGDFNYFNSTVTYTNTFPSGEQIARLIVSGSGINFSSSIEQLITGYG